MGIHADGPQADLLVRLEQSPQLGELPSAVGSPVAAVKNQHYRLLFPFSRQRKLAAILVFEGEIRRYVAYAHRGAALRACGRLFSSGKPGRGESADEKNKYGDDPDVHSNYHRMRNSMLQGTFYRGRRARRPALKRCREPGGKFGNLRRLTTLRTTLCENFGSLLPTVRAQLQVSLSIVIGIFYYS